MYNENDFASIDLDEETEIKQQLMDCLLNKFQEGFEIYNCCVNDNENKIYYCYCGYEDGDTFYAKVNFNNDAVEEIEDVELKEIILMA